MTSCAHLWAVGFAQTDRAAEVRDEITRLAWERHNLRLLDMAVAVRYSDGLLTLNGEPYPVVARPARTLFERLLADLSLGAPPLCSPAVGDVLHRFGDAAEAVGISDDFIREVARLARPGTSVLFVLDQACDIDAILRGIRGLGGTVLKTNVDLARAELIQATLAARAGTNQRDEA
jgi:uncharacterized membrane protein